MRLINISEHQLCSLDLPARDCIVISIQEEHGRRPDLEKITCPLLTLQFSDIGEQAHDSLHGTIIKPMSEAQASQVLSFVDAHASAATYCIIQCTVGISRSSAVALGLHITRGHQLADEFWSINQPQPHVVGQICIAAGKMHAANNPNTSMHSQAESIKKWKPKCNY